MTNCLKPLNFTCVPGLPPSRRNDLFNKLRWEGLPCIFQGLRRPDKPLTLHENLRSPRVECFNLGPIQRKCSEFSSLWRLSKELKGLDNHISASSARLRDVLAKWQTADASGHAPLAFVGLSSEDTAVLSLNLLAAIYGATAVLIKAMEGDGQSAATGTSLVFFLRFVIATLAFAPFVSRPQSQQSDPATGVLAGTPTDWDAAIRPGIETGLWMFLGDAGQAIGLETASAGHTAVLLTFSVILVPFLEAAFEGRRVTFTLFFATLVAALGMVLLEEGASMADAFSSGGLSLAMVGSAASSFHWPSLPPGDIWCLASSVGFALYVVRSEEATAHTNPIRLASIQLTTVVVVSLIWQLVVAETSGAGLLDILKHLRMVPWGMVIFTGAVGTGLAQWIELESLRSVTSTTATLIFSTVPLWSALLAYFILGETMDLWSCVGAGLILLASVVAQVRRPHKSVAGRASPFLPAAFAGEGTARPSDHVTCLSRLEDHSLNTGFEAATNAVEGQPMEGSDPTVSKVVDGKPSGFRGVSLEAAEHVMEEMSSFQRDPWGQNEAQAGPDCRGHGYMSSLTHVSSPLLPVPVASAVRATTRSRRGSVRRCKGQRKRKRSKE